LNRILNTEKKFFYYFIIFLVLLSFIFAILTFYAERVQNPDFSRWIDAFFWWTATLTTAGAGSVPITDAGKFFGMGNMIIGAVLYLAILSELVFWVKAKSEEQYSGYKKYTGTNHILILGYNELTLGLIHLLEQVIHPGIDIVLVTNQIDSNPKPDRVRFVRKNHIAVSTLEKVNAHTASIAFILNRDDIADKKVDYNTMLTANLVEQIERDVFTFVEISDGRRAKAFDMFHVDATFTDEELFQDLKIDSKQSKLLKKLPKEIREKIMA
jgi:voltage-gated potassium channel